MNIKNAFIFLTKKLNNMYFIIKIIDPISNNKLGYYTREVIGQLFASNTKLMAHRFNKLDIKKAISFLNANYTGLIFKSKKIK